MTPLRLVCLICAALPPAISAQQIALEVDPAQTTVEFSLGATLHTVHGTFTMKRGSIRFDPATGAASGELVVDATSAKTGNDSRDKRMHSEILETAKYPAIVFRPDRVQGAGSPQGSFQAQMHGKFTIHGAEHEMTIPLEVQATNGSYTATAHFSVPYKDWGIKNPNTLFLRVSDHVDVTVHTVAKPAASSR